MRGSTWLMLAVVLFALVSCASEEAEPVDLDGSVPPATAPTTASAPPEDQNAESRQMARAHAEQQCFDDPAATEGVIRIVDPATDQVVASIVVDCDEVRAAAGPENDR